MKFRIYLAMTALAIGPLIATATGAQTIDVDWARGTDFGKFHTFTWATGAYPIQDPDVSLGFARAVQDELEQKDVKLVGPADKFDIFVTYNARVSPDPQASSRNLITVQVRIFNASNNNVVWRGGGYVAMAKDKEANRSNVRALLDAIFQKYPPSD
jgi:hypothetical protein